MKVKKTNFFAFDMFRSLLQVAAPTQDTTSVANVIAVTIQLLCTVGMFRIRVKLASRALHCQRGCDVGQRYRICWHPDRLMFNSTNKVDVQFECLGTEGCQICLGFAQPLSDVRR